MQITNLISCLCKKKEYCPFLCKFSEILGHHFWGRGLYHQLLPIQGFKTANVTNKDMISTQLCFIHKYTQAFHSQTGLINNHADGGENHPGGQKRCLRPIHNIARNAYSLSFLIIFFSKSIYFQTNYFLFKKYVRNLRKRETNMLASQIWHIVR